MVFFQFISSHDAAIENYVDQFVRLQRSYSQAKFPYWILVEEKVVLGLVVVAQEPRELIQSPGTPFVQLHLFHHKPAGVRRLLDEAERIADDHNAAFRSCAVDAKEFQTIQLLKAARFELFDEFYQMSSLLDKISQPETDLAFTRATPSDAPLILKHLVPIMRGSPDHLMQASVHNISRLPAPLLVPMLSLMEVIFARHNDDIIGLISLSGPTISMIGVSPSHRRRGYGSILTRHALWRLSQQGHKKAWLRVSVENQAALHIYKSLGFHITHHVHYYLTKDPKRWQKIPSASNE